MIADLLAGAEWRALAACKGQHELFWPAPHEKELQRIRREAQALAVCHQCTSMVPCREWARTHREPGIWGGETAEQREAAGFRPVMIDGHSVTRELKRSERAEMEVATLDLRDMPIESLERIERIATGEGDLG